MNESNLFEILWRKFLGGVAAKTAEELRRIRLAMVRDGEELGASLAAEEAQGVKPVVEEGGRAPAVPPAPGRPHGRVDPDAPDRR